MLTFTYKAKRGADQVVTGELIAANQDQAIQILEKRGLVPVRIQVDERRTAGAKRFVGTVKRKDSFFFLRNLATLMKGKVPLLKGISLLERRASGPMKPILADLEESIQKGLSLSQALEGYRKVFPPLLVQMVRGGESGGVLAEILERLVTHEEKTEDFRKKVRGALAYPLFVLGMGVITLFVLLTYFMPRLLQTYVETRQDLPWPTELVQGISQFSSAYGLWIVGFLVVVFIFIQRSGAASEEWLDRLKLRLPLIRSLVIKRSVMNFARTLSLLLEHGVPLVSAVPLAANTMQNRVLITPFKQVETDLVAQGASLTGALKKVFFFPPMALDLISVGEESGHLALSLKHLADTLEKEVEEVLKIFTNLLEPILILFVGSAVGFIVTAMLLPIFDMEVMLQ